MNIRNFVIIAHIDHGKSTLADRLLEMTNTVQAHKMQSQYLDQMDLERERGITINMAPVRMIYHPDTLNTKHLTLNKEIQGTGQGLGVKGQVSHTEYVLNLIDTPGHSDFGYEVSRSLKAVEGAILLVDATQGIQAQTLANFEMAKKANLKIIGALNKVDVNPPRIDEMADKLAELIGTDSSEIHRVSGKTGEGVEGLLDSVVKEIPPPEDTDNLSALIFSSKYDSHKGVIAFARIFGKSFKAGDQVKLMATDHNFKIKEVGHFLPNLSVCEELSSGDIGYIATGIKNPDLINIGDTIGPLVGGSPLPGFKIPAPVVFVSIYPNDSSHYDDLKMAIGKLRLNDSALTFNPDFSEVLGRGFRCGFLGRLHFEITMQRLEQEFDLEVVNSFPSVSYKIRHRGTPNTEHLTLNKEIQESSQGLGVKGQVSPYGYLTVENPRDLPDDYVEALEPITKINVLMPSDYLGSFFSLRDMFRISDVETESYGNDKVLITAKLPLSDLILDFDDKLKSVSSGFASFNYEISGYEKTDIKRLDIHVAGEQVMGLSRIIFDKDIESVGRSMILKLKDLLPKQQFAQAIQAVVGGRIIARETIPAMKKDVTGHLYGGDRTRKMKLWKKQKEGKARLKESGRVEISAEVFKELLKK